MRIASFLPSATEILFAIGAGPDVAAITFECDFPPEARTRPHVVFSHLPPGLSPAEIDAVVSAEGAKSRSLYFVDLPALTSLAPDLIILQDLCRVCAIDSPTLARDMAHLPSQPRVISLNAHSLSGVLAEIELLGDVTGHNAEALALTVSLRARIDAVRSKNTVILSEARSAESKDPEGFNSPKKLVPFQPQAQPRVLCLEWLDPPFQGGHWIPEMVALAGGLPLLATPGEKSRRITWNEILTSAPDIIVIMPCGYHLPETIAQFRALTLPPAWNDLPAVRNSRVYAVDGTAYFSRPGPRLVTGLEILNAIFRDEDFSHLPTSSVVRLNETVVSRQ
jgi:iron complex transport system substrate-binding protein